MVCGAAGAERARISGRRHADVAGEQALEMMRRIADRGGQFGERGRFLRLLDQLHRLGHRLAVAADLVGLAAQAGAIAGGPRGLAIEEEFDMLALRPPRRAARLAINAASS